MVGANVCASGCPSHPLNRLAEFCHMPHLGVWCILMSIEQVIEGDACHLNGDL
jgi:hypothetical protein